MNASTLALLLSGEDSHVDPASWTVDQLLHIRGAMWTARLNIGWGPRPYQDDNILAMDYYEYYGAEDRKRMIAAYQARGYTHAVTGPLIDAGYHGQYPARLHVPTQAEFDAYLDAMQEWWDVGICPIHFCHPDGMSDPNQMAPLDALYRQPRAQRLLRMVVYTGWEPWRYELTNAQWNDWFARGALVFPNAIRWLHLPADDDAPTGGSDQSDGLTNGLCWSRSAPYLHGFLSQVGGYVFADPPSPIATPSFVAAFQDYVRDSMKRFSDPHAYPDWPKGSAFGPQVPVTFIAGEYAAYGDYWLNWPEAESIRLGNIALAAGARGALDGCTP